MVLDLFFSGKDRINFAINEGLAVCNTDAASKALIHEDAGIQQLGRNTIVRIKSKKKVSKVVQS